MRPLELYLEGFKSYAQPTTFEFESRGLFGIVGPTGSGKSSILDGLIFGLYGKTLRLQRETKRLINSQAEEAKIRLTFEADGGVWQVDRVMRRKGQSAVALVRLDRAVDPVAGERNVNEKVVEILGLDFDAFCSSVSLPQGEFDRFLNARRSERTEILKGLFRLDRVDRLREAAKGRAALLAGQMQILDRDVAAVPQDAEQTVSAGKVLLGEQSAALNKMQAELEEVLLAQKSMDRSQQELESVQQHEAQTLRALAGLPQREPLDELEAQQDSAKRRLEEASGREDEASKGLEAANKAMEAIEQKGRSEKWCADVEGRLKDRTRLAGEIVSAESEVAQTARRVAELTPKHLAAEADAERAEQALRSAQAGAAELRDRHAAHHLRSLLHAGDECPVCEQDVAAVPPVVALPGLKEADAAVAKAESDLKALGEIAAGTGRLLAVSEDRRQGAARRLQILHRASADIDESLRELAGTEVDAEAALRAARAELAAAKQEIDKQMSAYRAAAAAQLRARTELDALASTRAQAVNQLTYLAGVLDVDQGLIDWQSLVSAAKVIAEAGRLRVESLKKQKARLQEAAGQSAGMIAAFKQRFGASAEQSPTDVVAAARGRLDNLRRQIEESEQKLARKAEAERQIASLAADKALFDRLIGDLTDSKFTAYLLDEQRRLLARIASDKLFELTGRYVFDDDGDFNVIDQATGSTRTPDTLSGGETFLASLAMALALAEAVALEGGRLGCFFLDEGFGSLDAESLDLALEGIEALAVPGRLIGLISHVGGIQARLDDLIILDKRSDGTTGVCQDGGPITFSPAAI